MGKVKKTSEKGSKKTAGQAEGVLGTSMKIKKKSKREKFAQKRKNLTQKLAAATVPSGGRKKKRRKPIKAKDMSMGTLKDALPSLETLIQLRSSGSIKTGVPEYDNKKEPSKRFLKLSRKAQKAKRAEWEKSQNVTRMSQLETLMHDKVFKQNPRLVIAEHIKNTRKLEEEMG